MREIRDVAERNVPRRTLNAPVPECFCRARECEWNLGIVRVFGRSAMRLKGTRWSRLERERGKKKRVCECNFVNVYVCQDPGRKGGKQREMYAGHWHIQILGRRVKKIRLHMQASICGEIQGLFSFSFLFLFFFYFSLVPFSPHNPMPRHVSDMLNEALVIHLEKLSLV